MCLCLPVAALSVPMFATDAGQQHYLKASFGMANKRAPQQQQQQQQQPVAGRASSGNGRSAAGSGSSTPNSLCGVSMLSADGFPPELLCSSHACMMMSMARLWTGHGFVA